MRTALTSSLIALLTFTLTALTPVCADDEQKAARLLLIEARKLAEQAILDYERSTDPAYLDLWVQAQAKLHELLEKYPTTDEGMALARGEMVHGMALRDIDNIVKRETARIKRVTTYAACEAGDLSIDAPECLGYKTDQARARIRNGDIDAGLDLLRTIEPPMEAYRHLADAAIYYTRHRRSEDTNPEAANQIIHTALNHAKTHNLLDEDGNPLPPNENLRGAFHRVIDRLVNDQNFDVATEYIEAFPSEEDRQKALNSVNYYRDRRLADIAQAQIQAKDFQAAVDTAALMHNEGQQDWIRNSVVGVHLRSKDLESALALAQLIGDNRARHKRIHQVANAQIKAGELETALSTAELLDESRRDAVRSSVVGVHLKSGYLEGALAIAQLIGHEDTRHKRIYQVANARTKAGNLETALSTAELLDEGRRDSVRDKVVGAHLKSKDLESALALAQLIGDNRARHKRIHQVANAQIKAGELETALSTAELLDESRRDAVRSSVVGVHLKSGYLEGALAIAQLIGHEDTRHKRIYQVANARTKAGNLETALSTAELLDEGRRDSVRDKVVGAHLKSKDLESALALAQLIGDNRARHKRIHQVANAQIKAGELETALSTAELLDEGRRDSVRDRVKKARQ